MSILACAPAGSRRYARALLRDGSPGHPDGDDAGGVTLRLDPVSAPPESAGRPSKPARGHDSGARRLNASAASGVLADGPPVVSAGALLTGSTMQQLVRLTETAPAELHAPSAPPDRSPVVLYLASLSAGSRAAMAGAARDMARFFGSQHAERFEWWRLRYVEAQALRSWLAGRYAPATANRYLSCFRGIMRQAFRCERIGESDYRRVIDLEPVRGSRKLAGRALSAGELRALFASCDVGQPLGARNAALLALLYGCGLRRAEVVALDRADVLDLAESGRILVRQGKGNKDRVAHMPEGGRRALESWLFFRGDAPGPLLYPTHGGKPSVRGLHERRMCRDAVRLALLGVARRAGVETCSPHDFRRTFVGDLLDAGVDLSTVQRLAGHSNANTTARYDRRPDRARARAAELLSVPFTVRR